MKVKDKVFIVIGIGLIIMNISTYLNLKDLKGSISHIQNEVYNLDRSINNIEGNVSNTLNQMNERDKWLYNGSYSVTNISNDLKNATVALTWSLRSLNKGSNVYLIYREKPLIYNKNDKWTEISIENVDNLNYTKDLTLSLKNDYEFKVLVKGDKTSTSEKLLNIDFYSMMKDRVQIDLEPRSQSQSDSHVKFSFSGRIRNSYTLPFKYDKSNYDLLKLKNIILKVSSDDHLKIEFQILKDGKIVDEDTQFGTFHNHRELKLESFEFDKTIEYDIPNDIIEDYIGKNIEIIVKDYSGSTYIIKSHEI